MAEHQDDAQPSASGMTLGSKLREARLNQGLSTEQVAERLNLRRAVIENLESEQFETGVSPTFTKGYVKQYAKLMGLELEPLLKEFDEIVGISEAKLNSFSRRTMREATDHRWVYVTYLMATVIVASVVVWWFQQSDFTFKESLGDVSEQVDSLTDSKVTADDLTAMIEPTAAASQSDEAVIEEDSQPSQSASTGVDTAVFNETPGNSVVVESPNDNQQTGETVNDDSVVRQSVQANRLLSADNATDGTDAQSDAMGENKEQVDDGISAEVDVSTSETNSAQPRSATADNVVDDNLVNGNDTDDSTATDTMVLDADGMVTVDMELLDDCWMSIRDADNRTLAYGVKKAGRSIQVVGKPPINFRLGAPQNITISVGQIPVDLSAYNDGEIAKFEFPEVAQ